MLTLTLLQNIDSPLLSECLYTQKIPDTSHEIFRRNQIFRYQF